MANTQGVTTRPTTTDGVYSVALKIGRTLLENAKVATHYSDFDKSELEFGGIIEDLKIKLKTPSGFNPQATSVPVSYDTIVKRYFGDWTPRRIDTEIAQSYARAIVNGGADLSDFIAKCVNNLTLSEMDFAETEYNAFMLDTDGEQTSLVAYNESSLTSSGYDDTTISGMISNHEKLDKDATAKDILAHIIDVVKDFGYSNTTYSANFKTACVRDDIRIIMPYQLGTKLDVNELAFAFNMEKQDLLAKIIYVDTLRTQNAVLEENVSASTVVYGTVDSVIICDKNAIGRVVRGRELMTAPVKERFTQWYGMHYEDMLYYNPAMKAHYFMCVEPNTKHEQPA